MDALRKDAIMTQKKGLPFIMASVVIWMFIFLLQLGDRGIKATNMMTFMSSCLLMPLAIFFSKIVKAAIVKDRTDESVKVEIHCREVTAEVSKLKSHIDNYKTGITASDEGSSVIVALENIFYFESVDKKTFIYTKEKVLSTEKGLHFLSDTVLCNVYSC